MSVQFQCDKDADVITLEGVLSHDDLSALRNAMNDGRADASELRIQANNLTGIHFCCLQYLMAIIKSMRTSEKRTKFIAPNNDFREVLMKLDFLTHL